MAKRKYKRDASGRFAGGGGGGSTASKGASAKPKAAVAGAKRAPKSNTRQKVIKFVAKHPRAVVATAYGATVAVNVARNHKAISAATAEVRAAGKANALINEATRYARNLAADRKGIGANRPGEGLSAAKKSRGAYKIRSS